MHTHRERKGFRPSYPFLVAGLLPLLVGLPAGIILVGDFNGNTVREAFHRGFHQFVSPGAFFLWGILFLCAGLILLYLAPVNRFFCACTASCACTRLDAEKVIRRFNKLHTFTIFVSVLGFFLGELAYLFLQGDGLVLDRAKQFFLLDAVSKGLLAGVIISFNLDNILFPAKKAALALKPHNRLRRTSLYRKIVLIVSALVLFLLFQIFNTSAQFFDLGVRLHTLGRNDIVMEHLFGDAFRATPELNGSLKVIMLKAVFYLFFVGQLMFQIKWLIRYPVNTIRDRLKTLNSGDITGIRSVDILSNDEFTEALTEINILIKKQQSELQCSSHRLESIVERAADPIISFDRDGRIIVCNPAARSFFGYGGEEVLNTPVSRMMEIPDGALDGTPRRCTGTRRDGATLNFEINVSTAESAGQPVYTAIIRDISRQIETEENLTKARNAAENANRMKTEFLANMSHELRTPLNAVLGFTQLLAADRNLTSGQLEKIGIISRSGEHLLSLINDILDISKIEAGKSELHAVPFSLKQFVEDIREMFSLRCKKAGLSLYVEFTGDIPQVVSGDLGKLRQVMINLVGNAVKFTPEGGIGIAVGPDGDLVRFAVTDSGKGIPADEIELIKQPFIQSSVTDNEGGTGLGLAISSRYIKMMGGDLSIRSELARGSTFSFAIPLPATDESAAGSAADEPVAVALKKGSSATALIVDDKELNRLVLKEMLSSAGFTAVEAENGRVAVDLAREIRPDFILMDIKMPVLDGYGAVRELKADPSTGMIPVFALTASAFTADEKQILASGFDGFLAKPFKRSALFGLIRDRSGVQLEYETGEGAAAAEPPDPSSVDWPAAARALGGDGISELDGFVTINDFTAVRSLADRLASAQPTLAALLRWHAGSFDETGLSDMVNSLREAGENTGKSR